MKYPGISIVILPYKLLSMRLFTILLILLSLFSCSKEDTPATDKPPIDDDLDGPISRPSAGYGKDGTYAVAKDSFPSPLYAGKYVCVFHPAGVTSSRPVIFFSHPYGGEESSYNIGLFNFIAKKGYVVVFAPYPTLGVSIDD